jgi:arginyl-tRNA synthetase
VNGQARAWFKKIEDGDSEALRIFYWFKELTLKEVKRCTISSMSVRLVRGGGFL